MGFSCLAWASLGGCELNYSSHIDLIVLYDAVQARVHVREGIQSFFVRLTRNLVRILEERTGDGYVFRTDLRLRPDPASTPLAMSVAAAFTYYESVGQNWERAALIKARPVAGDRIAAQRFLRELRPYIWRKNLDFAAIEDIHSIKRQINDHKGGGRIAVAGHDIKTGRGGIREIEFFAQTQQLIWGGRILDELQVGPTCEALRRLAATGRIDPAIAAVLIDDYRFLRRLEHRLQMVDDAQTHTLPATRASLERIAIFLGYQQIDAFVSDLISIASVEKHYAELFEQAPTLAGPGNLVFTGAEDDRETLRTPRAAGLFRAGRGCGNRPQLASRPSCRDAQPASARDPDRTYSGIAPHLRCDAASRRRIQAI